MNLELEDRVALVAAASSGLGKAVAMGLAREGALVCLCSRDAGRAEAAAAEIREQTGGEAAAFAADVTVEDDVRRLVDETRARFGRIDVCVTNAGGPPSKTFAQTTSADWRRAVELNFLSVIHFATCVLPIMQEQRWGRFLTITSVTVKQPIQGLILSNAVRAAVAGLVKSLANEYAPHGVLVNNVCPGYTATQRLKDLIPNEEAAAKIYANIPLGRFAEPEEFANLVVFLASERASYITGGSFAVDGGSVKGIFG
jgi:3-oxoacyl-[acyl-carrier protein] reductase